MRYPFIHKIVVPNTILIVDDDEMNRDVKYFFCVSFH